MGGKPRPEKTHRMGFQRQPQRLIVRDHMLRERHRRQLNLRSRPARMRPGPGKQRQRSARFQRPRLPQRLAPVEAERTQTVGGGNSFDRAAPDAGRPLQVHNIKRFICTRPGARVHNALRFPVVKPIDLPQSEPYRQPRRRPLNRARV